MRVTNKRSVGSSLGKFPKHSRVVETMVARSSNNLGKTAKTCNANLGLERGDAKQSKNVWVWTGVEVSRGCYCSRRVFHRRLLEERFWLFGQRLAPRFCNVFCNAKTITADRTVDNTTDSNMSFSNLSGALDGKKRRQITETTDIY